MPVCITFDTERNYYETNTDPSIKAYKEKKFTMLENAIPKLLDISDDYDIPYTFFLCGEVAENCSNLFSNMNKHLIGVHTHPFTHEKIFKGTSPNDRINDYLCKYTYDEQCRMISEDLRLIKDNLNIKPKIFRAGKHSVNLTTFKALDFLNFQLDCSLHPQFQLFGWHPYKIKNTNLWELPTYSDISPEIAPSVKKLFRITSFTKDYFDGVYVGIIHPMIFGNPMINTPILFEKFIDIIENMVKWDFNFLTIEEAFNKSKKDKLCNNIGFIINKSTLPLHYLLKNYSYKSVLK